MPTFKDATSLQAFLNSQRTGNNTVGFVPTMGALHKGHLALVTSALSQNEIVVVSIFVNPTQFGNAGDLKNYPRTLSKDETLLKTLHNDIIVFAPNAEDLYNGNITSNSYNFGAIANEMEGKYRQGHFNGVGTVLELLFDIVKPDYAYFGEKDFQQLQIVRKLISLTKQPVTIVGCPIYRENSGLAMSSRNERLSKERRDASAFIYKTLQKVKEDFKYKSARQLNEWVKSEFDKKEALELEYFEIANIDTLKTIKRKHKNNKYRAFIAVFVEDVRLIDNVSLNY
ncbi:pantoate--beta-alanine ligase [Croceibacter atlanticus]|uniref:pantoate--beta-alanine ligase n=1 Tax=Croceibacter atlanticus TaxID=313588 RepID=UPI0030F52125